MVTKESKGLYNSDECYKMAVTDALSVALKMIGVGADIYMGYPPETKYQNKPPKTTTEPKTEQPEGKDTTKPKKSLKDEEIEKAMKVTGLDNQGLRNLVKLNFSKSYSNLTAVEKDSLLILIKKEGE